MGVLGCLHEVDSAKKRRIYLFLYCLLFLLSCVSVLEGNYKASDLGPYLDRFETHDDSYFGWGYARVTDAMRFLFGTSRYGYMITISVLQMLLACICARMLDESGRYTVTYLALFNAYWGISFSIEIIRSGIAIAFSLVAIILALKKKRLLALVIFAFSVAAHVTEIILLPMLLLMMLNEKRTTLNHREARRFVIWGIALLLLDAIGFGNIIGGLLRGPAMRILSMFGLQDHYEVYLEAAVTGGHFSYISKQYVFYFLLGFLLILLQKHSGIDRRCLFGYFIGLSINTFFSSFGATMRLQWVYLIFSVPVIFGYVINNRLPRTNRVVAVLGITLLQSIMAMLYLETRLGI